MTAYDIIAQKLQEGMVDGNMHGCLRDIGRLAGGYAASGALGGMDLFNLENMAKSLAKNATEAEQKWGKAVVYGRNNPVKWEAHEYYNQGRGGAIDWEDTIGADDSFHIVDHHYLQDEEVPEPGDAWSPVNDLITYLATLFDSEEHVAYVTESWYNEKAERHLPKKGAWDRTAGQLISELQKCNGDLGGVIGDWEPDTGAWIRFNPVDGQGIRDENVTSYRFALIESDSMAIQKQYALLKEMELPIAALVHSGRKSLHAIVRVEADDYNQYRERVDYLYEVCKRNGLQLDRQNRNPSRLSRMPGVTRGDHKQFLVGTGLGKSSWAEWREWIEDINDDLPDIEEMVIDDQEPDLAADLIKGVLREGHKMLLAGPSKAGKSFALQQLSISVAEGMPWFGWNVAKGRVLYVNLELDSRSCRHRFWKIYQELGIKPTPGQLDVWNLRGSATSLDKLAPKLIRRAGKKGYKAVVIDPIYKVLTGDENSAEQMALFCNQFDRICKELGAATIYCHHHSKGAQGQKNSRDRSSGSGVFARDPDAIIDMIELLIDDKRHKQICDRWECDAITAALDQEHDGWRDKCPQDDTVVADKLSRWADENGMGAILREVRPKARNAAEMASGWRLEGTVREYPSFAAKRAFFRYPIHVSDGDLLRDAKADGEEAPWEKGAEARKDAIKKRKEAEKQEQATATMAAYNACKDSAGGEAPHLRDIADSLILGERGARKRINEHPKLTIKQGLVFIKEDASNE